MNRRGNVIAIILVVAAALASMVVVTKTFTTTDEVPLLGLSRSDVVLNIQDIMELAVRNWLREGYVDEPLFCNGIYEFNDDDLLANLEGHVLDELDAYAASSGIVVGDVESIAFAGTTGVLIELEDTQVTYSEDGIEATTTLDSEYLVTARVRAFQNVVEDWMMCDMGDMREHLTRSFGGCFFGRAGNCQVPQGERVSFTQEDWAFVHAHNVSDTMIATGVRESITALNGYLAGAASCSTPSEPLAINCQFSVDEAQKENHYVEWSTVFTPKDMLRVPLMQSVEIPHVAIGYDDVALECPTSRSRTQPNTPLPTEYSLTFQSLKDNYPTIPILEPPAGSFGAVSSDRGAMFDVTVTCTDSELYLRGQPVIYTFKFSYGYRKICEMPEMTTDDPCPTEPLPGPCLTGVAPNCPACETVKTAGQMGVIRPLCRAAMGANVVPGYDATDCEGEFADLIVCCLGVGLDGNAQTNPTHTYGEWQNACCGAIQCNDFVDDTCNAYACDSSLAPPAGEFGILDPAAQCVVANPINDGEDCGQCGTCSSGSCAALGANVGEQCGIVSGNPCRIRTCAATDGENACSGAVDILPDGNYGAGECGYACVSGNPVWDTGGCRARACGQQGPPGSGYCDQGYCRPTTAWEEDVCSGPPDEPGGGVDSQ